MEKEKRYTIAVLNARTVILGQLELYKIEFSETSNNKYLQVMNDLNTTLDTIERMDKVVSRLTLENNKLKNKL
jgi:ribosome maturation factor RimP